MIVPIEYAEPAGPAIAQLVRRHLKLVLCKDLPDEMRLVLETLIGLSFDARRSVARMPDQLRLCIITQMGKTVVSRAVRRLKDARMHESWRTSDEIHYRVLHDATDWKVRWRIPDAKAREIALATESWLYGLNLAAPDARELPYAPEPPGLEDALREVARDTTLARPLSIPYPPQSRGPGRAARDAVLPDNQQRPCLRPHIGNEPAAGALEADTPAAGFPTSVSPTSEEFAAGLEDFRRRLHLDPTTGERVSSPANPDGEIAVAELAHQLTASCAGASDVRKHLIHPEHLEKGEIYLTSAIHPDGGDVCSLHEDPDGSEAATPGTFTGDIIADLRRDCGELAWLQYRGAWNAYLACDAETVIEVLGDYRLRALNHRAGRVGNPGAWMARRFVATSRKWRERLEAPR